MNRQATVLCCALLTTIALTTIVLFGCDSSTEPNNGAYSVITTYAGNGVQGAGIDGVSPRQTPLYWPQDMAFGPDGRGYIIDWNNYRIRVVENDVIRTIIGSGNPVPDGESEAPSGVATEVDLNHPAHINFDPNGNIILSGFHSSAVFLYDFASNIISPVCGNGVRSYGGDGGPAIDAIVNLPVCSHYDSEGNLYIMDQANQRLRLIDPAGMITTFCGTGTAGFSGDDGAPDLAQLNLPVGQQAAPAGKFTIGPDDRIYIADTKNQRIRMIEHNDTPIPGGMGVSHEEDVITTIAGNGTPGYGGDGGPATAAMLNNPNAVALDPEGNLYISDTDNHVIRKVDTSGIITTFVGHPQEWCPRSQNCPPDGPSLSASELGDGGNPRNAYLHFPAGITFDGDGNFYIADRANNRIRVVLREP